MKQKPMAVFACIGTMMIAFFSSCATDDNAVAINTAENPEANQLAKWHPYEFRNLLYLRYYHPDGKFTTYRIENGQFKNANLPDYTMQVENEGQWGGTLASVYGTLAFEKATGWSRWLLLNEQQSSLWCNNEFYTPLPEVSEQ